MNNIKEFPGYLDLLNDITDSRFTTLPGKELVRAGTRIMYDRMFRYFHESKTIGLTNEN